MIFEFTSLDRVHGFIVPDLGGVRAPIEQGKDTQVRIAAPKAGTYEFHCDLFSGARNHLLSGRSSQCTRFIK